MVIKCIQGFMFWRLCVLLGVKKAMNKYKHKMCLSLKANTENEKIPDGVLRSTFFALMIS